MELKTIQTITTDVLVIGGGGAGLRAAIEAKKHDLDVLLISKSRVGYGNNTAISGGAFAAATHWGEPKDNPEEHFKDTVKAGCFINNPRLVDIMVRGAEQQIYDLIEYGVKFEKRVNSLNVMSAPGHTCPRAVACEQNLGIGFTLPMVKYAQMMGIQLKQGILITKLLKVDKAIIGAVGLDKNGQLFIFNAKSIILATGGLGQIFSRTDNAVSANGTGYLLAYEASVPLIDMEFTQFYPASLANYSGFKLVDYEALVAAGEVLFKNSLGEDILEKYGIKDHYLMTRDVLSRAIMLELVQGKGIDGAIIMDVSSILERSSTKPPILFQKDLEGVREFRIAPTFHYHMGGIKIDGRGKAEFAGLYAAGEVCGGIHGANRLAFNSITDIFVFGAVAGDSAAANALGARLIPIDQGEIFGERKRLESLALSEGNENAEELRRLLKEIMWYKAGILRDEEGLKQALKEIGSIRDRLKRVLITSYHQLIKVIELSNMLIVSEMVCKAALKRRESRGAHYRTDYPEENNKQWLKNIKISCKNGHMTLKVIPVQGAEGYRKLG